MFPHLPQTINPSQVKSVLRTSVYFTATITMSWSPTAVYWTSQWHMSFWLGLKISTPSGWWILDLQDAHQGTGGRRSLSSIRILSDLSGPCSHPLHSNYCFWSLCLSPVHPVSQIPLLLSLGEQRCYSLYVTEVSPLVAGRGHIAISLAFPPLEKGGSAQLTACMSIRQFCTCVISLST